MEQDNESEGDSSVCEDVRLFEMFLTTPQDE